MKTIELANEQGLMLGFEDGPKPYTYVFQEEDYSDVECLLISTCLIDFKIIIEATALHMPKLKLISIEGAKALDIFNSIYEKLDTIPEIEEMNFNRTGMIKPPEFIWDARHLTKLEFRHEDIQEIPSKLFELINLRSLTFAYCLNITTVPDKIKKLVNLVDFNVFQAGIIYLSHELFLLPNITSIKLSYSSYSPTYTWRQRCQ
jgi:Leucine-rich repeat (LRR) protein